jgi:hypothetical protein
MVLFLFVRSTTERKYTLLGRESVAVNPFTVFTTDLLQHTPYSRSDVETTNTARNKSKCQNPTLNKQIEEKKHSFLYSYSPPTTTNYTYFFSPATPFWETTKTQYLRNHVI